MLSCAKAVAATKISMLVRIIRFMNMKVQKSLASSAVSLHLFDILTANKANFAVSLLVFYRLTAVNKQQLSPSYM